MDSLLPSSPNFIDIEHLLPHYKYAANIPKVKEKLINNSLYKDDLEAAYVSEFSSNKIGLHSRCGKRSIWSKFVNSSFLTININAVIEGSNRSKLCFPTRQQLFSALTKIDLPQRRSMITKRESNLTVLKKETLM